MPVDVTYVGSAIGFHRAFRTWDGPVGTHLRSATEAVRVVAITTAPRKTGELASGHRTSYGSHGLDLESQVVAVPKHAIFILKGTKPHVIRPKTPGGRLVFFWAKVGRVVSFQKVNHPGIKANNYLGEALKKVIKRYS